MSPRAEPAPPPPQPCSAPGCDYTTPENIPTWELVIKQQEIHLRSKHPELAAHDQSEQKGKLDKKVRPSITPQMTEENWRFILDEWSRYKRQTGVKGQQLLDELWSCMSEDLRQLAFNEGGSGDLHNETDLLARIKKLAVVTLHPSLHVVSLHELRQQSDENTQTFAAKVRGIAASCGLTKKCPGCQEIVSFSDETCYHQVLSGLADQSMKERALTQAMMGTIKDLDSLVKWCTADEAGRLATPNTMVGRIQSTFKKLKNRKCRNCGAQAHGDGSRADCEKECKAFGKICSKCQKRDHFSAVCKSSSATTNAIAEEDPVPAATNNSLGLFALQEDINPTSPRFWRAWETTPPPYHPPPPSPTLPQYTIPTQNRFAAFYQDLENPDVPQPDITQYLSHQYQLPRLTKKTKKRPAFATPEADVQVEDDIPTNPIQIATFVKRLKSAGRGPIRTVKLPHILHSIHDGWLQSPPKTSPMLSLNITLHSKSYTDLGLDVPRHTRRPSHPCTPILTPCLMDTGAQMSLAPVSLLAKLGIEQNSIFPLQSRVAGASAEPIQYSY